MKTSKYLLAIALAFGFVVSGPLWADRGHSRVTFGINLGVPLGPWFYPPYSPYYYPYPPIVTVPAYPNIVTVPPSPPVYIEKGSESSGPAGPATSYWYYCTDPQGYYPYVKDCQTSWMTVLPQAPMQPGPR